MDQQQKQKVMLGLCAALVAGAGGYFVVFRDSQSTATQAAAEGASHRRAATSEPAQKSLRPTQDVPEVRPDRKPPRDDEPTSNGGRRIPGKDNGKPERRRITTAA